jgi:hypothetical protein
VFYFRARRRSWITVASWSRLDGPPA